MISAGPLLIDPPVSPLSSVVEIRAWLTTLRGWARQYAGDAEALRAVATARAQAERLLARVVAREAG